MSAQQAAQRIAFLQSEAAWYREQIAGSDMMERGKYLNQARRCDEEIARIVEDFISQPA
jgi:hypothetical protein